MMNRFRVVIFGISVIVLAGALYGGLFYASKFNKDASEPSGKPKVAQTDSNKHKDQKKDDKKQAPPKKDNSKQDKPAPKPKSTPKPAPKPQPKPAPSKPQPPVAAKPQKYPETGANGLAVAATSVLVSATAFLAIQLRRQKLHLRANR